MALLTSLLPHILLAITFVSSGASALPSIHEQRSPAPGGPDPALAVASIKRSAAPGGPDPAIQLAQNTKRAPWKRNIVVTGATNNGGSAVNADGSVPMRLEIRDLQKNYEQWNLYILALDRLMRTDASDPMSWYQLAGIHGRPYQSWDDVGPGSNSNAGYCTHGSVLFPTWHRPYLAIYEQALYSHVQFIANQFQGDAAGRYQAAANTFRIPFWDWAQDPDGPEGAYPTILTQESVEVEGPNGKQTIKNPLFDFQFQTTAQFPDSHFGVWKNTVRYPKQVPNFSQSTSTPPSQNDLVARQLANSWSSFRDRLYNLFTAYHEYQYFANKAWIPSNAAAGYDSIESIHDQIHGLVGNGGHMAMIDYSAFDPVFFLHHTNVDRTFAIWQNLNPDSFVVPVRNNHGTFFSDPGTMEDINTPLAPFRKADGNFFNSQDIRNTKDFGYTYPELQDWNIDHDTFLSNLKTTINAKYGRPASFGRHKRRTDVAPKFSTEWVANLKVQKYALGESFFIHIFLGDYNTTNAAGWSFEPNLVGTHTIFTNKVGLDGIPSTDFLVTGVIPLTTSLQSFVEHGQLKSLDPVDAEPFLKQNLHWRVTDVLDREVTVDQITDLIVSVGSANVTVPQSADEFPVWGPMSIKTSITEGRPAGLDHVGQI